jgi:hypothetical protein
MQLVSEFLKPQEPPELWPPPDPTDDIRGSLLGNSRVQLVNPAFSNPNVRTIRVRYAFRRLAWAGPARRNTADRARLEFTWLAENRERYKGRWIALEGNRLLAVGASAREVYAAIANHMGTPLVTRVEPAEEAYFAGW